MSVKRKKKRRIFYMLLGLILLTFVFMLTFLLLKHNILPFKYLSVYAVVVGVIPILLIMYTLFRKKRSKLKVVFAFIEFLYIILLALAFIYLNRTFNFLDDFTKIYDYETKNYYVLTLIESNYGSINDLKNKSVGYSSATDESAEKAIKKLEEEISGIINKKYDGLAETFSGLDSNEIDSMLIGQGFYDTLKENDENISNKYKVLYQFSIKEKAENVELKDVDVTKEPFNVYISGIDSYGKITDKTRSDVNILMSVNPKSKRILLVNIPRDYYVTLADINKKDKLTHAGMYGVDTSVKTIENLLDIEINYYVKVNYNALIKIVDALGGVEVYSDHDFVTTDYHYKFKKGYNNVNGKQALDFVRTRKAFLEGDRVRGENQQKMIQAIIKKSCSASMLLKYNEILKSLEGSFATNISTSKITSIINMQLANMVNWEMNSISLNGSDGHEYTYSYPIQELYVMYPNEETVITAKEKLADNLN